MWFLLPYFKKTRSSTILEAFLISSTSKAFLILLEYKNVLPFAGDILISGSEISNNESLKTLSPENPERITNKAKVPTITPTLAIAVIILIVLFPLLEIKYLLAM